MKTFWVTFVTLFVAELGDKTQLSVILLTSKTGEPIKVFIGAASRWSWLRCWECC